MIKTLLLRLRAARLRAKIAKAAKLREDALVTAGVLTVYIGDKQIALMNTTALLEMPA